VLYAQPLNPYLKEINLDFKLTELLALYGAVLSTFVFIWNVLRSKHRITVNLIYGIDGDGDDFQPGVYALIRNPSTNMVHISGMSILYPWKKASFSDILINSIKCKRLFTAYGWVHTSLSFYDIDDECPISIQPGHAHKVLIPDKVVDKILEEAVSRTIMVSVQDQLGNNTCSKAFEAQKISPTDD